MNGGVVCIGFLWGSEQNKNRTREENNLEENLRETQEEGQDLCRYKNDACPRTLEPGDPLAWVGTNPHALGIALAIKVKAHALAQAANTIPTGNRKMTIRIWAELMKVLRR